ncbi:hypothetical protein D3C81_1107410 [compost metagenome]
MHDVEEHLGDLLDQLHHEAGAFAERGQRGAEEQRHQQDLQDVAVGERAEHRLRDDVHKELDRALAVCLRHVLRDRLGVQRRRIDIEAHARLEQVRGAQADQQREGRHHFKVEQRLAADAADLLHVAHAGHAGHYGTEDDRADDHLDQLDEAIAQRLHGHAGIGPVMPQQDADQDGEQHLHVQDLVEGFLHGVVLGVDRTRGDGAAGARRHGCGAFRDGNLQPACQSNRYR